MLDDEGLAAPSSGFMLQHGGQIPGEWHLVGILDAKPDAFEDMPPYAVKLDSTMQLLFGELEPSVREMLGRPPRAYGVTPLVVFRSLSAIDHGLS
jgi:hypothetical protein